VHGQREVRWRRTLTTVGPGPPLLLGGDREVRWRRTLTTVGPGPPLLLGGDRVAALVLLHQSECDLLGLDTEAAVGFGDEPIEQLKVLSTCLSAMSGHITGNL
jgi:hypothetical protein